MRAPFPEQNGRHKSKREEASDHIDIFFVSGFQFGVHEKDRIYILRNLYTKVR